MLKKAASKAAASEGPTSTDRTSCGLFALIMDLGERKSPQRFRPSGIFWYVEDLNVARTKLAVFFSILLEEDFDVPVDS